MTDKQKKTEEQFHTLLETVERLRRERYAHIDPTLVRELLRLHADPAAIDTELARGAEQAVERRLNKET